MVFSNKEIALSTGKWCYTWGGGTDHWPLFLVADRQYDAGMWACGHDRITKGSPCARKQIILATSDGSVSQFMLMFLKISCRI